MLRVTRFLFVTTAVAGFAAALAGCSASGTPEDDGAGGSPTTTTTTTSSGSVGGGSTGGAAGAGGAGGDPFPCGIDCDAIETDACHESVCDMDTLKCNVIDREDGSACDDAQYCTVDDSCQSGECVGGLANDCGITPSNCHAVACDENSKSCLEEPVANGTSCVADDLCLVNTECSAGLCVGAPKDCTFAPVPDVCHISVCNPANGMCEAEPGNDGDPCSDPNDLCTVNKSCNMGLCEGGQPKNCSQLTSGCQLGVCDAANGNCMVQNLMDGDPCDDLDPCTSGELCSMGQCNGGSAQLMCLNGDNCCPGGCDELNDDDCTLQILLLGDDVAAADWDAYRTALTAAGATWTEWDLDITTNFPTTTELTPYNVVIWFDENTINATDNDAQGVADWLDLGGRSLFVTGVDFMWDFQNGTMGMGEKNLYDKWNMVYVGDYSGTGISQIEGIAGDPIGGSFSAPNGLQLALTADSNGDYANEALGAATHSGLYGSGGTGSGRSALAHYNAGGYRVAWLGVNFHNGLTSPTQRATLMTNVLNYFK